jgi:hypothetical protein
MYWGALSTDIKKSSVNWNGLPKWMERAVQYHNTLLETCVEWYIKNNKTGTTVELLPNAPEGDAYTYLFTNNSLLKLRRFVISLGIDIQKMLNKQRESASMRLSVSKCNRLLDALNAEAGADLEKFNTYRLFQTKKYYGGIYIRIGIGFSADPPIPYNFNRYRGGIKGNQSHSYRGGVITMSEKAEELADFDYKSYTDEGNVEYEPVLKECYMEDGIRKFKDVYKPEKKMESENANCRTRARSTGAIEQLLQHPPTNEPRDTMGWSGLESKVQGALTQKDEYLKTNTAKSVNGFCVFVEYHPVLSDTLARTNPYTKTLIDKEYIDIHEKADECILSFIKNTIDVRLRNYYNGGLVKQKRDSTSMFVILHEIVGVTQATIAKHAATLYEELSKLLASLPRGSSIGIAYGEMKELEMKRPDEGTFMDYFQASVNLAARMVMRNWSFSTKWGITGENDNHNRIAFTSKRTDLTEKLETNVEGRTIPFTVEYVPLSALNAGGPDTIMCISSKYTGWRALKVGDIVWKGTEKNTGEIIKDMGDTFILKFTKKTETVKRSDVHLVKGGKEFDDKQFKKFQEDLKLKL